MPLSTVNIDIIDMERNLNLNRSHNHRMMGDGAKRKIRFL